MKFLNKIMLGAIMSISVLFSTQAVAENMNPYQMMQQTADKLFNDIKTHQKEIKADPNYLRTIVRNDLMPYVHVKYAGLLVLGKYLKTADEEQRNRFFDVFKQFIEQSYAQVLTQYTNQKIEIEKEKAVGDALSVSIRVNVLASNNTAPIKLDFKWRKNSKTGEWQAYDMAAEGVSMLATKQNEWGPIIRQKGIDTLIDNLSKSVKQPITLSR